MENYETTEIYFKLTLGRVAATHKPRQGSPHHNSGHMAGEIRELQLYLVNLKPTSWATSQYLLQLQHRQPRWVGATTNLKFPSFHF